MAKKKPGKCAPRVVRVGPKPDKMVYFLRQIRQHEASVRGLRGQMRNEKNPSHYLDFLVSMQRYRINLCKSRIKLFNWFLKHGSEIGIEPDEARVRASISRQQDLIEGARREIGEAEQRRKLKLRKSD